MYERRVVVCVFLVRAFAAIAKSGSAEVRNAWVASLLGYTQQASFTQWFSRRFGMAPRTWRATRQSRPDTRAT